MSWALTQQTGIKTRNKKQKHNYICRQGQVTNATLLFQKKTLLVARPMLSLTNLLFSHCYMVGPYQAIHDGIQMGSIKTDSISL